MSGPQDTNTPEPANTPILDLPKESATEAELAEAESRILKCAAQLSQEKNDTAMISLIQNARPFLKLLARSKAVKLVDRLVDMFIGMESDSGLEGVQLLRDCIEWAREQKRTYMRQSLQVRLLGLLFRCGVYGQCLTMANELSHELKRLDDKLLLLEVHLWQSKAALAVGNEEKARNALVGARSISQGVYVRPEKTAELDLQMGVLNADGSVENFKVAYSYFYEAFEQFDAADDARAATALKYMMLCELIRGQPEAAIKLIMEESKLKYADDGVRAMVDLAKATKNGLLADYCRVLDQNEETLSGDKVIARNIKRMKDYMVEENLKKLLLPYSRVQLSYVAGKLNMSPQEAERCLRKMILDKKINGVLDMYGEEQVFLAHDMAEDAITTRQVMETFEIMNDVVKHLIRKSGSLMN